MINKKVETPDDTMTFNFFILTRPPPWSHDLLPSLSWMAITRCSNRNYHTFCQHANRKWLWWLRGNNLKTKMSLPRRKLHGLRRRPKVVASDISVWTCCATTVPIEVTYAFIRNRSRCNIDGRRIKSINEDGEKYIRSIGYHVDSEYRLFGFDP